MRGSPSSGTKTALEDYASSSLALFSMHAYKTQSWLQKSNWMLIIWTFPVTFVADLPARAREIKLWQYKGVDQDISSSTVKCSSGQNIRAV